MVTDNDPARGRGDRPPSWSAGGRQRDVTARLPAHVLNETAGYSLKTTADGLCFPAVPNQVPDRSVLATGRAGTLAARDHRVIGQSVNNTNRTTAVWVDGGNDRRDGSISCPAETIFPARLAFRPQVFDHCESRAAWPGTTLSGGRRIDVADLKKGARITGNTRDKLAADLKKKYEKGASIRALAESTGRSYGFVHRVLSESGVQLRGRGGATRVKKK